MRKSMQVVVVLGLAIAAIPAISQVRCTMPNGVVIEQRFASTCPAGAIKAETTDGAPAQIREPVLAAPAPPVPRAMPVQPRVVAPPIVSRGEGADGLSPSMWLVVIGGVVALIFAIKGSLGVSGKPLYCATCGHEGPGKTVTRGSILVEIILWLCFLVPGLIYSIWRQGSKYKACSSCGASTLVPMHSPVALAARKAFAPDSQA